MTTSDDATGKLRISSPHGGGLGRFVFTVLIVLAIVLATLWFSVRTEGGRDFVRSRLETYLGMELTIEDTRIGFPYDLVVAGVRTRGAEEGRPGVRCRELRIGLAGWRRCRMALDGPAVTLVRDLDGRWEPARFSRLGEMVGQNILAVSRATLQIRQGMEVSVRNGEIDWYEGQTLLASADGVGFRLDRVSLPGRPMHYYRVSVQNAQGPSGSRCGEVVREWLASETIEYLEIEAAGSDVPGTGPAFWEVE